LFPPGVIGIALAEPSGVDACRDLPTSPVRHRPPRAMTAWFGCVIDQWRSARGAGVLASLPFMLDDELPFVVPPVEVERLRMVVPFIVPLALDADPRVVPP
jgi:hypothetical protein